MSSAFAEPIRALVLDIDDTLVDTQAAMRGACTVGAAHAWPGESPETHTAVSNWFYDDPHAHFEAYTRGEMTFAQMREARYNVACERLGLDKRGFDTFEAAYRTAFEEQQYLFDDALPMLDAAEAAGVRTCFVTNSGDAQTAMKLRVTGMARYGDVVTTDTLGIGKPDPRIFDEARRRTGVDPAHTLCVGDTLGTDVVGGRAAGMPVAWLQRLDRPEPRNAGWGTPPPDEHVYVVHGLNEVSAMFRAQA